MAEEAAEASRPSSLATLKTYNSIPGVFAWAAGPPKPGANALLAINLEKGPLRGQRAAKAHLGMNGWQDSKKEVRRACWGCWGDLLG